MYYFNLARSGEPTPEINIRDPVSFLFTFRRESGEISALRQVTCQVTNQTRICQQSQSPLLTNESAFECLSVLSSIEPIFLLQSSLSLSLSHTHTHTHTHTHSLSLSLSFSLPITSLSLHVFCFSKTETNVYIIWLVQIFFRQVERIRHQLMVRYSNSQD